jgi:hypothetical protein
MTEPATTWSPSQPCEVSLAVASTPPSGSGRIAPSSGCSADSKPADVTSPTEPEPSSQKRSRWNR